jgi:GntR family transcriptional regulator
MPLAPVERLVVRLNSDSNIPPYAQLASQLNCIIEAAQLKPGDLLPPIRKLAGRLRLNPNTVARAYAELARAGRLNKRVGCGCFVAPIQGRRSQEDRLQPLTARIEELVHDAHTMGITTETLLGAVRRVADNLAPAGELAGSKPRRATGAVAFVKPPAPSAKSDSVPAAAASLWPAAGFVD